MVELFLYWIESVIGIGGASTVVRIHGSKKLRSKRRGTRLLVALSLAASGGTVWAFSLAGVLLVALTCIAVWAATKQAKRYYRDFSTLFCERQHLFAQYLSPRGYIAQFGRWLAKGYLLSLPGDITHLSIMRPMRHKQWKKATCMAEFDRRLSDGIRFTKAHPSKGKWVSACMQMVTLTFGSIIVAEVLWLLVIPGWVPLGLALGATVGAATLGASTTMLVVWLRHSTYGWQQVN